MLFFDVQHHVVTETFYSTIVAVASLMFGVSQMKKSERGRYRTQLLRSGLT
jgi:predicted ribosome-associated RNA-binding protein Tma20